MKSEIDSLFEKANTHFFNSEYDKAYEVLKQIVKKNPRHFPSYEKMAQIELFKNNYKGAIAYYKKYIKYNPDNSDVWNELGNIYFDQHDYKNSVKSYKRTLKLEPDAYWAYYNIGLATLEIENGNEKGAENAKNWFKKSIKLNAYYYPALNEMGLYYLRKLDYRRAKEYFVRAIKSNPNYKFPYFNLAKLYKETNQTDKAKTYLIKAIKCDPDYTSAYNNIGIIYYEEENYNAALYYYTRALVSDPNYKYSYYNMGLIFDTTGKYKKAYTSFEKALAIDPHYELAAKERARLDKNYKSQVESGEELVEEDLLPDTYKSHVKERELKESLIKGNTNKNGKSDDSFTEKFGRNITKQAKEGKLFEIVGREKEIDSVLEILFSMKKNNPLLIGKAGVGKTAIVEGIARIIASGDVPDFFKDKEIVEINMGTLVAGTTFRGDFEKRLKTVIEEIKNNENLILFIDEIHTIMGAGETTSGTLNAANILKPALARGELRCIGATTSDEYQKYFQKDSALDRRFQKVQINELNQLASLDILKKLKPEMEKHYGITIAEELLETIIELSHEQIPNRVFPDKSIDVMEKAFSRTVLKRGTEVTARIIEEIVSELIGLKLHGTEEEKQQFLQDIDRYLKSKVLGQDEAIDRINAKIKMTKNKLHLKPEKPDGVFLFTGTPGVGKTYLAKEIGNFLFDLPDKVITLNMAEYTEPHSVSKLLGAPPGYIGYDEKGLLGTKVIEHPSCILLLDNIEKAHPEVLKIFLQIFDEGKITDTSGKVIYFSNTTIIMTNTSQPSSIGFGGDEVDSKQYIKSLTGTFPEEFLNRIDEIIVFKQISREVAGRIVEELLIPRAQKVFKKRGLEISFSANFSSYILEEGYSKSQGVRNLERVFEKEVMSSISHHLFTNPDLVELTLDVVDGNISVVG